MVSRSILLTLTDPTLIPVYLHPSYIDLYAGNLQGIRDRIPYFQEIGLTYLHLMPCSERRSASRCYGTMYSNSDQRLGTLKDLAVLAKELHEYAKVFPSILCFAD